MHNIGVLYDNKTGNTGADAARLRQRVEGVFQIFPVFLYVPLFITSDKHLFLYVQNGINLKHS